MHDAAFWQALQQQKLLHAAWWFSTLALPVSCVVLLLPLVGLIVARQIHTSAGRLLWMLLICVPPLLILPSLVARLSLATVARRLGLILPEQPQMLAFETLRELGAALNLISTWGLTGAFLSMPMLLAGTLLQRPEWRQPIVNKVSRAMTALVTQTFGRRSGAVPRLAPFGTLTIIRGQRQGVIEAVRPNTVIGSKGSIQLNDAGVSRSHVHLDVQRNLVYAHDLGSSNGTYLCRQGQTLEIGVQPCQLFSGDRLFLGDPNLEQSIELLYQREGE